MRKAAVALLLMVGAGFGAFPLTAVLAVSSNAPTGETPAAGVSGEAIVQYAEKFVGYPYSATGNSPSTGFSCIGFVSYVYQSLGINLPDDLGPAMAFAPPVAFSDLQPGDVLFFQNTVWSGLSHAAIYIGGGKFIHAEWYNRGVVITSFNNDPVDFNYWPSHYLGANRPWGGGAADTSGGVPQPAALTGSVPASVPARVPRPVPTGPVMPVRVPALNVRAGPSLNATIRTVVRRGTGMMVLGHRNGWYRVELPNGTIGWVVGLGIGGGAAGTQRTGVSGRSALRSLGRVSASRLPSRSLRIEGLARVEVNGLRVHSAPAIGAAVIGSVTAGQRLGIVNRAGDWLRVRLTNGQLGWIDGSFASTGTRPTVARPRAVTHRVTTSASSAATAVTRVGVNLRRSPSISGAIEAIVPAGRQYSILGWAYGWAHVRLATGAIGWMSGTVLGATAPTRSTVSSSHTATTVRSVSSTSVVTAGVRFHSGPGLNRPVIGLVAAGTHVQVLGSTAGWTEVRLPSRRTGYILGIYVRP